MINRAYVRQRVNAGDTDQEIAAVCNCKKKTIAEIRRCELKLSVNKSPMQKRVNRNLIAKLFNQGKKDREVARITKTSEYYVRLIRVNELKISAVRKNKTNACICSKDGWIFDKDVIIKNNQYLCPKCGKPLRLGNRNPTKNSVSANQKIKLILQAKQEVAA